MDAFCIAPSGLWVIDETFRRAGAPGHVQAASGDLIDGDAFAGGASMAARRIIAAATDPAKDGDGMIAVLVLLVVLR